MVHSISFRRLCSFSLAFSDNNFHYFEIYMLYSICCCPNIRFLRTLPKKKRLLSLLSPKCIREINIRNLAKNYVVNIHLYFFDCGVCYVNILWYIQIPVTQSSDSLASASNGSLESERNQLYKMMDDKVALFANGLFLYHLITKNFTAIHRTSRT